MEYLESSYNLGLVAVSYIIATFAGYAFLDVAGNVRRAQGLARLTWILVGATAFGTGIWSMHFVGMLAFSLPVPVSYDLGLTGLSMIFAVLACAIAYAIISRPRLTIIPLMLGGIVTGAGIATMHYTGMAAMRTTALLSYDRNIFIISIVIAILASIAAMWIAYQIDKSNLKFKYILLLKIAAALIMGFAVVGMHYTGMAAARFEPTGGFGGIITGTDKWLLGYATTSASLVILLLTIGSVLLSDTSTRKQQVSYNY